MSCNAIKNNGDNCKQTDDLDANGYCKYHRSAKFKKMTYEERSSKFECGAIKANGYNCKYHMDEPTVRVSKPSVKASGSSVTKGQRCGWAPLNGRSCRNVVNESNLFCDRCEERMHTFN